MIAVSIGMNAVAVLSKMKRYTTTQRLKMIAVSIGMNAVAALSKMKLTTLKKMKSVKYVISFLLQPMVFYMITHQIKLMPKLLAILALKLIFVLQALTKACRLNQFTMQRLKTAI